MPQPGTQLNGKRSRRGRLSEGRPTKKTPEMVARISQAISLDSFHSVTSHFRRGAGRRYYKRVLSPQGGTSSVADLVLSAAEGMAIARELAQPDDRNLS